MDCIMCPIADVCKIKDSLKEAALYGDLTFFHCKIKENIMPRRENRAVAAPAEEVAETPTQLMQQALQHVSTRTPRTRDFREVSNAIRHKDKEFENKVNSIRVMPDDIIVDDNGHINCPTCSGTTTQDDLKMCSDCNTTIVCSNCGTEHEQGVSCEPCWLKK